MFPEQEILVKSQHLTATTKKYCTGSAAAISAWMALSSMIFFALLLIQKDMKLTQNSNWWCYLKPIELAMLKKSIYLKGKTSGCTFYYTL